MSYVPRHIHWQEGSLTDTPVVACGACGLSDQMPAGESMETWAFLDFIDAHMDCSPGPVAA